MTVLLDYMLEVAIEESLSWIERLSCSMQECEADVVIANDSDLWPYLGVLLLTSRLLWDFVTNFSELLGGQKS